jgi:primosomal protein N' (replication factor Y) (superfamily II helicase)
LQIKKPIIQLTDHQNDIFERKTFFVDVILPVPIPKLFTYRVPVELNEDIAIGCRVIVPFGKKKILTGIIGRIHESPPKEYQAKYISELLDDSPSVLPIQIGFLRWVSEYYMCTIGEALNVAMPSGLKLSSESKIQVHPDFNNETTEFFTEREWEVIEAAKDRKSLTYREIEEVLGIKNFNHIVKSLLQKNSIIIYEEVKEKFIPKKVKRVRLNQVYADDHKKLETLFAELEKQPKQLDILLKYLQEAPVFQNPSANKQGVEKQLFKSLSTSSYQTLIKSKVFEEFTQVVSRFKEYDSNVDINVGLSSGQEAAKAEILRQFEQKDIVLFHGITGSGKTEIYIDIVNKVLESGSQVLYLLPEIALTTQIVSRLRKVFGDKIGVYHSKFSDNERVEIWRGILEGRYSFIVGVRSSIFLPFQNLGLIVVDEEHENSYKQYEPAPRYHARDAAMVLAKMHQAKVLLGSATPSVESYYHAKSQRFGFVELFDRYGNASLPNITFVNIRDERKNKTLKGDFSSTLIRMVGEAIDRKEQAIIFQNRRGYAPHIACDDCAWIPKCEHCDVSLTYHMYKSELRCHYCGYHRKLPSTCPACGSSKIRTVGFGTEKLEEDLKLHLPVAKVKRMDLDTTRSKYSYQNLIEEFEKGDVDILVGTQMVSKGLDFDRVSLVGILDADRMIHFPDFRSFERAFQLITQVSGRAGRREKTGTVVIQTANPNQQVLRLIMENNYIGFFAQEIAEREKFGYPPFVRLIRLLLKHEDQKILNKAAFALSLILKEEVGNKRVLGPEEPLISRIRNLYLMQVFIKIERDPAISLKKFKDVIFTATVEIQQKPEFKKLLVSFDVDPS